MHHIEEYSPCPVLLCVPSASVSLLPLPRLYSKETCAFSSGKGSLHLFWEGTSGGFQDKVAGIGTHGFPLVSCPASTLVFCLPGFASNKLGGRAGPARTGDLVASSMPRVHGALPHLLS